MGVRIKTVTLNFIPMYILLTRNYLECAIFSHPKNLSRFINVVDFSPSPPHFLLTIFSSVTKQKISINQKEIWGYQAFLRLAGVVQWLKGTTLKQEISQWLNFYLLMKKIQNFSLRNVLIWLGPGPGRCVLWDECYTKIHISVPICQCRDKLLFLQRLFNFFHNLSHFPVPSFPHLGELLVTLDVFT